MLTDLILGRILRMTTGRDVIMAIRVFTKSLSLSFCGVSKRMWKNLFLQRWNRSSVLICLRSRSSSTSQSAFLPGICVLLQQLYQCFYYLNVFQVDFNEELQSSCQRHQRQLLWLPKHRYGAEKMLQPQFSY